MFKNEKNNQNNKKKQETSDPRCTTYMEDLYPELRSSKYPHDRGIDTEEKKQKFKIFKLKNPKLFEH